MLDSWMASLKKILYSPISIPFAGPLLPFWRRKGPKWYSSSWWPGETLCAMQYSLIGLLAVAHSERLEPRPLIEALASEHRGRYKRRLKLLAKRMDSNSSLIAALEKTPDILSESAVLAIRFGSQSGTLSQTYAQLLETEKQHIDASKTSRRETKAYLMAFGLAALVLLPLLMIFVVPTLQKLAEEYGMKNQFITTLQGCWAKLTDHILLVAAGVFGLGWLARSSRSKRFFRRQIADKLFRSNSLSRTAQLFRMLSINVAAGRPLAGSLSTLAKYHFDPKLRQRLLLARNEVEQGVPAWSSLVDAKLISVAEHDALNGVSDSRVQAWMIHRMASVKQANANQSDWMQSALIQPLSILLVATGVLWICYSFFSFITNLIHSLAV
ncbi:MAG: type II secretion system F family protein [Planctomycetota bacterium]|nr:type II secretion system F family protein [Planctomycetota bacterium]